MNLSRRQFNKIGLSSMAYFSAAGSVPMWIAKAANAQASQCLPDGRILVIIQLAGGIDGLNTVIPLHDFNAYEDARPNIHVPQASAINLDGLNAFHPRLPKMADWYQTGNMAIVNNVGYVNPNLSHFTSTDHWEFGYVPGEPLPTQGWISRFIDNSCGGSPDLEALTMVASGISDVPDSMEGSAIYTPPAISNPDSYSFDANPDPEIRLAAIAAVNSAPTINPNIDFLQQSQNTAEASAEDIATAILEPDLLPAEQTYADDSLGNGLRLTSQIIRAGFDTRLFYVKQGGYDTHSGQVSAANPLTVGDHPELLADFDRSVNAFLTEMQMTGNLNRVVVMTFSEFGRRFAENGSLGTDHGAANCLFAMGGPVIGGVYGGQPNLTDLIKGNLKHTVDFRSVYSRIIETWFNQQAAPVFGQEAYDTIIAPELPEVDFLLGRAPSSGIMMR